MTLRMTLSGSSSLDSGTSVDMLYLLLSFIMLFVLVLRFNQESRIKTHERYELLHWRRFVHNALQQPTLARLLQFRHVHI